LGGCSHPDSDKAIIFIILGANAKFFGQKPPARNEKVFLYLLNEKTEFILSDKIKCPKSGIFTNNYWAGRVGQSKVA